MNYVTPLRYPGGKSKLTRYMCAVLRENQLLNGTYVEPYAGGAAVALNLLVGEYVRTIIINDISVPVHAFWHSVLHDTVALCKKIEDSPIDVDEWTRQREVYKQAANRPKLEVGFATFFLNRVNRSGILRGGIIGGKNQTGNWKMDARFNKRDLISRIQTIASYKDRIVLHRLDATKLIDDVLPQVQGKALVYFDPPYYGQGNSLYENYYQPHDHTQLAAKIKSDVHIPWIMSYDNVPEIRTLYAGCRQAEFSLTYTAQKKYVGSEVLIYCDTLQIPELPIYSQSSRQRSHMKLEPSSLPHFSDETAGTTLMD